MIGGAGSVFFFFPKVNKETEAEVILLCNKCLVLPMFSGSYFSPMGKGHTNEFGTSIGSAKAKFFLSSSLIFFVSSPFLGLEIFLLFVFSSKGKDYGELGFWLKACRTAGHDTCQDLASG